MRDYWRVIPVALLCACMPGFAYVVDDEWSLFSKDDDDPLVYTKTIEGQSIKAIKAVTVMDTSMQTLLTVLTDASLVPDWIPVIGEARLLQETDPDGVSVNYMLTKFPWPIRNRDAVVETIIEYDESSNTVTMESTGMAGYVDEIDGVIRTPTTFTRWKIIPRKDGKLHVEIITHSDPRGRIPKWLINMIFTRTPGTMFSKLQQTVDEEKKRNRPFDEIYVFGKEVGL